MSEHTRIDDRSDFKENKRKISRTVLMRMIVLILEREKKEFSELDRRRDRHHLKDEISGNDSLEKNSLEMKCL